MNNYPALDTNTGKHYVRYTLQSGPYKGNFITVIDGNCKGAYVLDTEIFDIMDEVDIVRLEYDHLKLRYNYDCNGIDVDFLDDDGVIYHRQILTSTLNYVKGILKEDLS